MTFEDKQGLVVLPSHGWLPLFPYNRISLISRYIFFQDAIVIIFALTKLDLLCDPFLAKVSFGGGDSLLFGSAMYLDPFHKGAQSLPLKIKHLSWFFCTQVQPATATGLQGRSTLPKTDLQVLILEAALIHSKSENIGGAFNSGWKIWRKKSVYHIDKILQKMCENNENSIDFVIKYVAYLLGKYDILGVYKRFYQCDDQNSRCCP